ncbi:hypothetical protein Ancab_021316 [Ancistrocladus abbreviatus]
MELEVELITREIIKPSSATPAHLHHHDLSLLDQLSPCLYMSLVFYYETSNNNTESNRVAQSTQLRRSLSESLALFYPLAGRVMDNLFIDCNDEGIEYLEANVKCQLSEVIRYPLPRELCKLIPRELDDAYEQLLAIQVNFFDCGGMAIGLNMSHKVSDASSFITFVRSWAAISRGDSGGIIFPQFDGAKLFPPRSLSAYKAHNQIKKEKPATKRLVFRESTIASVRDKYAKSMAIMENLKPPTRVEALSSFIWNQIVDVLGSKLGSNKLYLGYHAVDLRRRMDPPVPVKSFGNLFGVVESIPSVRSEEKRRGIVEQIRHAIIGMNAEYVKRIGEADEYFNFLTNTIENSTKGEIVAVNFSSWCRFPIYESDFGWGKPIWVSPVAQVPKNFVVFMDSSSGDGIEAWITLDEEDMTAFEADPEIRAYVA